MNIGIIGATGNIGRRILAEASRRDHHVTAFTRDKTRIPKTGSSDGVVWKEGNVQDATSLEPAIVGLDVLISTYQPGNASRDFNDTVQRSISDPATFVTAAKALGNQPVVDANGQSRISYEDCAVAIIDEAELPRHIQRRFTIGY